VTRLPVDPALLGLRTNIDGEVDSAGLRDLYRSAKLVVTPTKNQPRDSGHSATLQAMACGKAVILSDTKGLWDRQGLVHGKNIWLVPPEDSKALRGAIDYLLSHSDLCVQLGQEARRYVLSGHTSGDFGRALIRLTL
jgi:glycosyltransferase involved in cell wall biosynthesis